MQYDANERSLNPFLIRSWFQTLCPIGMKNQGLGLNPFLIRSWFQTLRSTQYTLCSVGS